MLETIRLIFLYISLLMSDKHSARKIMFFSRKLVFIKPLNKKSSSTSLVFVTEVLYNIKYEPCLHNHICIHPNYISQYTIYIQLYLCFLSIDIWTCIIDCFYKLNYRKRFPYHLMYKQKTCFYNKTLLSFSSIFSTYMKGFF